MAGAGGGASADLNLVDMNLSEVPFEYATSAYHTGAVTTLNLSENCIKPPGNIGSFTRIHTLILDKNSLPGVSGFPKMPSVTTLWFNNNEMTDLVEFMDEIVENVFEISERQLFEWKGNYSAYLEQREETYERQNTAYKNQQKENAALREFYDQIGRAHV